MSIRGYERSRYPRKTRAQKQKWRLRDDHIYKKETDPQETDIDNLIDDIYKANEMSPERIEQEHEITYISNSFSVLGGSATDVSNVAQVEFSSDTDNSSPLSSSISSNPAKVDSGLEEDPEAQSNAVPVSTKPLPVFYHPTQDSDKMLESSTFLGDGYITDGPVFRAQIAELEKKTAQMKENTKNILKASKESLKALETHMANELRFRSSIKSLSFSIPALMDYMDRTWSIFREQNIRIQKGIKTHILNELQDYYDNVIKGAETRQRAFQMASTEYYKYTTKYLSTSKADLLKSKRYFERESKNIARKSKFDMVRFDYFNYLQTLHRGIKENEILLNLLKEQHESSEFFNFVTKGRALGTDELSFIENMVKEKSAIQDILHNEQVERRHPVYLSHNRDVLTLMNSQDNTHHYVPNTPSPESTSANNQNTDEDQDLLLRSGNTMEGVLYSMSTPNDEVDPVLKIRGTWKKYWCVLDRNQISEFYNWDTLPQLHMSPIHLANASVHIIDDVDRQFCFEVITPHIRRIYQALSSDNRKNWVACIRNSIEEICLGNRSDAVNGRPGRELVDNLSEQAKIKKLFDNKPKSNISSYLKSIFGTIFTKGRSTANFRDSTQQINEDHSTTTGTQPTRRPLGYLENLLGSCIKRISTPTLTHATENPPGVEMRRITTPHLEILRQNLSNQKCAECGVNNPTYCCTNFGIIICTVCSVIHKKMNNTVISLLTNLDRFTPDIEELVISIGNDTSNSMWDPLMHLEPNEHPEEDASIDSRPRIKPDSTYDQKTRYIQDKYTARVYVCSASSSPNQELMDAIGLDDIPAAMLAISRGVDFNTAWYSTPCSLAPKTSNDGDPDGQERTPSQCCEPYHPLHKALLYGREVPTTQASNRSLLFPMAELLFQHGASTNVIDLLTHKTLRQIIDHDTNIQSSAIEYIDERHRFHGKNSRA